MTAPVVQVEIEFYESASLGGVFILDSATQGVLNGATFTLASGLVFVDVTQWCTGQITMSRGRSRELDQYQAGTLDFTLRNEDRRFDPSNTASPYAPGIVPRARVTASIAGVQVFGGYVDDYDVVYEKPKICTVTVSCIDGFSILANSFLQLYEPSEQLSGDRITDVLNVTEYSPPTAIDSGVMTLQSNIFTGTPQSPIAALDHLQTVARTEAGFLFFDRTGVLTFFQQDHVSGESSLMTFSDLGGSDIGYQEISQKSQALLLYNQVFGTRNVNANVGGDTPVTQQEDDLTSQKQYLIRALPLGQLESDNDGDVDTLCAIFLARYSQPDVRFDTVTLELNGRSAAQIASLVALDLVQLITVKRTPPGTGSPTTITKLSIVDAIKFALDVSGSTYQMTLQLGSAS